MTLHKDLGPNLAATVFTTGMLAYISMGMRAYTRITNKNWGVEDTAMSIACVPLLILSIVTAAGSFYGVGSRDSTFALPGNDKYIEPAHFWFFLYEIFYCVSIVCIKLSIALMLNRIAGTKVVFIYINYGIIALCFGGNLATILYCIFQCNPVEATWKPKLMAEGSHCLPPVYLQNVYYMCTSINISTDWASALMPIALLWNIQMNRNTKFSVAGILGLGIFTSVAGLVRLTYTVALTSQENYLYHTANILIWGYAEPALGMIVGNIATLKPLFRRMLRLGTEASASARTKPSHGGISTAGRTHPYKPFDIYELGTVGDLEENLTLTHIQGGHTSRGSVSSDNESQKQILEKSANMPLDSKDIVVSKQVEVQVSHS